MSIVATKNPTQKKDLNTKIGNNSKHNLLNSFNYESCNSPLASFSPPPTNAEQKFIDRKNRSNFLPQENVVPLGKPTLKSSFVFNRGTAPIILEDNNSTNVPTYIPTPIAVLEQQKKDKKFEPKIGEKRIIAELEKNSNLPIDLADDEILNPQKGSLISLQRNQTSVPNKKTKIVKTTINKNGSVGIRYNAAPKPPKVIVF